MRHSSSAPSSGARCGRCLPSLRPNCSWVSRSTANRLAAAPGFSQPGAFRGRHFPPEAPGSGRSRTHSAGPQPLLLTAANSTAARESLRQPSAAVIGLRRRGGARSSVPPEAAPDPTAVGCGLRQSQMNRPAPPALRPRLPSLGSRVSSAPRSASFAEQVSELSERSWRLLSRGGRRACRIPSEVPA